MLIWTAVLALAVAVLGVTAWWRVRRALAAERARRQLTEAMQHRDLCAFTARVQDLTNARAVMDAAAAVVDQALAALPAHHQPDPTEEEGGSS
ncbi:hypothetical protein [Streptomyces sp. Wb2n-11]|uniref:hypothetical protein n=1 Tax=Streptomyces sp. Wb2n-11 TaxID=1030533 RepID=UPI000A41DE9A|nr:hypothetical protein [Streptomyces sp. Wb2n-11]